METKIFYAFIITLTECYLVYSNLSTEYPISGGYPMGTGTGTVSRPIGLVGMDICRSLGTISGRVLLYLNKIRPAAIPRCIGIVYHFPLWFIHENYLNECP
jgi:hypothetical protein